MYIYIYIFCLWVFLVNIFFDAIITSLFLGFSFCVEMIICVLYVYAYAYIYMNVYIDMYTYIYIYIHMYIVMYIYLCTHAYI